MAAHLTEQRGDGVVAAVEDEQQRRHLGLPEVKQLVLLCDDLLTERRERVKLRNQLTRRGGRGVATETFTLSPSRFAMSDDSW